MIFSTPVAFVVLLVCGAVAAGSLLVAGHEFHTAYRVFSTPTGRVSGLLTHSEGPIELHGAARTAEEVLDGPFTGEDCCSSRRSSRSTSRANTAARGTRSTR